jgi:hypothetical protein
MSKKIIALSFFSGFFISSLVSVWLALALTHLSNFKMLKAHSYGYTSVKRMDLNYINDVYLKNVELEIIKYSCSYYRSNHEEALWLGFRMNNSQQVAVDILIDIGAVKEESEILAYCDNISENITERISVSK